MYAFSNGVDSKSGLSLVYLVASATHSGGLPSKLKGIESAALIV